MSVSPHTRAAILSIGDELTLGQNLDTNSKWLSEQLLDLGILPIEHCTVPDSAPAITDAFLRLARGRSADSGVQLVIVTGGLGPTADDLTRQALASALGERLIEDQPAVAQIAAWFEGRGRPMPVVNRVQALRPHTATMLPNPVGTAPGLHATLRPSGCDVFCLPGPPREMTRMFADQVVPRLRPPPDRLILTRSIPTFGLGESEVAERLGELMDRIQNPLIGTTASGGIVTCRIRYEATIKDGVTPAARASATAAVDAAEASIRAALGGYVLGVGPTPLAAATLDLLVARRQTLGVVESCTGGLLGATITEIPGASAAFHGGLLTYSNLQKHTLANVPESIFATGGPGAVSAECARAMAVGGLDRLGSDHCLAITGIAGPEGGTPTKPVGTVWISLASRHARAGAPASPATDTRRFLLAGDRANIRDWSAKLALGVLRLHLIGEPGLALLRQQDRRTEP